jgi:hypothetical protein
VPATREQSNRPFHWLQVGKAGGELMSKKPISPLRQRMIENMSLRKLAEDTQRNYIRAVKNLARPPNSP